MLDPFVGTGTTVSVAKSLGRRGVGVEINERYVEISERNTVEREE